MAIDQSMLWNEIQEGQTYPHNEKWYSHLLDQYKLYVEAVQRGENSKLYRPISHIEGGVPWVFLVLHLIVLGRTFPWSTVKHWLS